MIAPASIQARRTLLSQYDGRCLQAWPKPSGGHVWIFTDGAGRNPAFPMARITAWGWCFAETVDQPYFEVGACGTGVGPWHTVGRAELLAMIDASKFCLHHECDATLFSDNLRTVNKMQ